MDLETAMEPRIWVTLEMKHPTSHVKDERFFNAK